MRTSSSTNVLRCLVRPMIHLLFASMLCPAVSASAQSNLTVTLHGLDAVTTTVLPALDGIDIWTFGQCMKNIWDCTPAPDEITDPTTPHQLNHPNINKQQELPLEFGETPTSPSVELDCVVVDTVPWNPQFNCRNWSAFYLVTGELEVGPQSFHAAFGDGGRVDTDFDLGDTELIVTLFLVGHRVDSTGCTLVHPFDETIIYAADVYLSGISGSMDLQLAAGTNSVVEVERVYENTLRLDFDDVRIDTTSNNRMDELLIAASPILSFSGIPVIGGLAPVIQGLASLAWLLDVDVANVLFELASAVDDFDTDSQCGNSDDCLAAIAQSVLSDNRSAIADLLSDALSAPLQLDRDVASGAPPAVAANGISLALEAALTDLTTSADADTLTTAWDASVTSSNVGACANGLTGYAVSPPGAATPVDGDVVLTAPFDVVGQAAQAVLQQGTVCNTPVAFGSGNALLNLNGNLTVARGGPNRVDLIVPMRGSWTAPPNPAFTFNARLRTRPDLSLTGQVVLVLEDVQIQNLSLPPLLSGPLQNAVNSTLDRLFPIPVAQRSAVYILPHVYIEPVDVEVDSGSFSVGVDIQDGRTPVDLSVDRFEGAAPYVDTATPFGTVRTVPVQAIIKNNERWERSPPVDLTIETGLNSATGWLPPLAAGAELAAAFAVQLFVDADGRVALAPEVAATLDMSGMLSTLANPLGPTIHDPDRQNNVLELSIDDAWFRPDYTVEIVEAVGLLRRTAEGVFIRSSRVVGADFTVTVSIRNIGGERGAAIQMARLNIYVNDEWYASTWIGSLEIGEEDNAVLDFSVSEGPYYHPCAYEIRAELEFSDKVAGNNIDVLWFAVESSSCLYGGATDADLQYVEETAEEALESKWENLNTVEWMTDNRGLADSAFGDAGSNAPIFDRIDPVP